MDDLYVNINDPSQKRRVLLQCSRDLLSSLKILDEVLESKNKKSELFNKMCFVFEELSVLNDSLKSKLPMANMENNTPTKIKKQSSFVKSKPITNTKIAKTKLDFLEEELSAIESKLSSFE